MRFPAIATPVSRCSRRPHLRPVFSGLSAIRSTDTTRSSSSSRNTVTPCAARPWKRDAVDRHADGLALVADQHQIVAILDREGRNDGAVLAAHAHGDDARAAAAGDAVFIGAGALAEAVLRNREDELLPGAQLRHSVPASASPPRRPPRVLGHVLGAGFGLLAGRAARRAGLLEIGARLGRTGIGMMQQAQARPRRRPRPALMPRTPVDSRPLNTRTSVTAKRMHLP